MKTQCFFCFNIGTKHFLHDKINLSHSKESNHDKNEIIERFTSYVKVDTQSNENNDTCPSTPGQLTLGKQLVEELKEIGMQDVTMDDNGYVMATLLLIQIKSFLQSGFLHI